MLEKEEVKISVTWRLLFWLLLISSTGFFILKALARTYDTWFAGLLSMLYFFSYGFSLLLIRRREE